MIEAQVKGIRENNIQIEGNYLFENYNIEDEDDDEYVNNKSIDKENLIDNKPIYDRLDIIYGEEGINKPDHIMIDTDQEHMSVEIEVECVEDANRR